MHDLNPCMFPLVRTKRAEALGILFVENGKCHEKNLRSFSDLSSAGKYKVNVGYTESVNALDRLAEHSQSDSSRKNGRFGHEGLPLYKH